LFSILMIIDYRHYLLPDCFTYPFILFGLLTAYWQIAINSLITALYGLFIGYALLYLPALCYQKSRKRAGLGGGDIKLMAGLGCWLPPEHLPYLLLTACLMAFLCQYQTLKHQQAIAFGPYLIISGWGCLLLNKPPIG